MMKKRLIRWVILIAIGFGIGSAIGAFQDKNEQSKQEISLSPDDKKVVKSKKTHGSIKITADFSLIDHNGQDVTQDSYTGTYKLVFFGFTLCPEVCPTGLNKISVVMEELNEGAKNITPLFISVDPEYDTPEIMKEYVAQFHPQLVGLTGSPEQLKHAQKAFRVYAKKSENDMFDHSAFIYLMAADNSLMAMYPAKDSATKIAQSVEKLITKQ